MVPAAHLFFHVAGLGRADAVFPGKGAPHPQGGVENGVHRGLHPVPLLFVAAVGEDGGVEIAVPGVAKGADGEIEAPADLLDGLHHGRDFAPGHGGVFQDHGGLELGQGRERRPPGTPHPVPLGVVFSGMN